MLQAACLVLWLAIKRGNDVCWFCLGIQYFCPVAEVIEVASQSSKLTGSSSKIYCSSSMHSSNTTLPFLMRITINIAYRHCTVCKAFSNYSFSNTHPSSRKTIMSNTVTSQRRKRRWNVIFYQWYILYIAQIRDRGVWKTKKEQN